QDESRSSWIGIKRLADAVADLFAARLDIGAHLDHAVCQSQYIRWALTVTKVGRIVIFQGFQRFHRFEKLSSMTLGHLQRDASHTGVTHLKRRFGFIGQGFADYAK
ncbi:hypothetical protein, partial [Asticcacaulis biprosthecium]|uniref:hypothetical protein n=1 Tax=Asticcacaulis biprosthecium TaxID=76891 RepID=UPI00145DA599